MKNLIIALFLFTSICLSSNTLRSEEKNLNLVLEEKIVNTYLLFESNKIEIVFEDGEWWVYEYNEDGEIVNFYPLED